MKGRLGRTALVAVPTALCAAAGFALIASAASSRHTGRAARGARVMRSACAVTRAGVPDVLHYVHRPASCAGAGRTRVDFVRQMPVYTCRAPSGTLRLVRNPGRCSRAERPDSLPHTSAQRFCASRSSRVLRAVSRRAHCSKRELAVVLPGNRHADRLVEPVAGNDDAATAEDRAAAVDVLANDRPASLTLPLSVRRLDTTGTRGDVRIEPDGSVSYDPAGRFDSLRAGETATDAFGYTAGDGLRTAGARVTVTVEGRNSAPHAADDAAATIEDPPAPVEIDAIKADAPAGTPGRDTDPDHGTTLHLASVDASSARGASVATTPHGTIAYDPGGRFESLGEGETATDTFSYRVADEEGASSDPARVTVTVAGANDPPALGGIDAGPAQIDSNPIVSPPTNRVADTITVSDPDTNAGAGGTLMHGATVAIARGLDTAHHDTLGFTPTAGIDGSYDPGTGALTLEGAASPASYQDVLRSVTFTTDASAPTSGPDSAPLDRTVSFRLDDGASDDNLSNVVTRDLHVTNTQGFASLDPAPSRGFSPDLPDYVVRCTSGTPVKLTIAAPPGTEVDVDGQGPKGGDFTAQVPLEESQGFGFAVTRPGRSATYHVRCLPSDFPPFQASVPGRPQAQWLFLTPNIDLDNAYMAVFDANGVPVWWQRRARPLTDFKLLSNGHFGAFFDVGGVPMFNELGADGSIVRSTSTVGSDTDIHDYQELPDGSRYVLTYRFRDHVDVSAYTGKPEDTDAAVFDAEVQQIGPNGELQWSWNSADHISLAETGRWWSRITPDKTGDGRNLYDIMHINSVEPDGDGVVVSMRHADAVYRIDRATGAIDWKLGGTPRPESLTIVGDDLNAATDFGGQHDARILPDGTLTLHDNGTGLGRGARALRFALDTNARTATLIESLSDPLAPNSGCCGSARKLPGGDWVMSWGAVNVVTELTPDEDRVYELKFGKVSVFSYRANPVLPGVLAASTLRAGMDARYPRP